MGDWAPSEGPARVAPHNGASASEAEKPPGKGASRPKKAPPESKGRPHVSEHVGRPPVSEVAKVGAQEARLPLKALAVGGGLLVREKERRARVPARKGGGGLGLV